MQRGLIRLGQLVPLLLVDERHQHRPALPEAGVVIVLRHLVEAELLVVVRTHPLGCVYGAFLQRRVDVRRADLLRHHAQLGEHQAGHTPDAELEPFQIGDGLDLFAEPAAHLCARVAGEKRDAAVVLEQRRHRLGAAAEIPPRIVLTGVRAVRNRGGERERRVLAEIVISRRVAQFHSAGLGSIQHLQRGYDLAGGESANLELAVGDLADALGDHLHATEQGIEALRPARRHAPLNAGKTRRLLRPGLRGEQRRTGRGAEAGVFKKFTSFHRSSPLEVAVRGRNVLIIHSPER